MKDFFNKVSLERIKLVFFLGGNFLALPFIFIFGIGDIIVFDPVHGIPDLVALIVLPSLMVSLKWIKKRNRIYSSTTIFWFVYLFILVIVGEESAGVIFWLFPFCIMGVFIMGLKYSSFIMAFFFIITCVLFFVPLPFLSLTISSYVKYRFISSLFMSIALSFFLEILRKILEQSLSDRNRELQEANRKLEFEIEEKKALMGAVAHDLRSPLVGIKSSVELINLMIKPEEAPAWSEYKGYLEENCNQSFHIIDDLLDMYEVENSSTWNIVREELNPVIDNICNSFIFRCEKKELLLRKDLSPDSLYALVQLDKFKRTLHNLISNAIKFTPRGGHITVGTYSEGIHCFIYVEDSGIGIPPGKQQGIFERFTRHKRPGTEGERTFGLGLYISLMTIKRFNGQLNLESEENKGSRFTIQLPLVD